MLYVQQSLGPDEELVHVGKFHWMYTVSAFMSILWGLVLSILIMFVAYKAYGYISPERIQGLGFISSIRVIHPGIRGVAFLFFIFGLVKFAHMMVVKVTTEIAITNNRLVYKRGLVARHVGEISIDRIEGVNVLQSILGRLFDYGRVMIRGMGVGEVVLPQIEDPIKFRRAIEEAKLR
ncbi:MAG: PH domain-containing protein [Alphaproteobacteria bacterium]|nr:PH domain-containing protein [Alphaproteobacteria bacterium]